MHEHIWALSEVKVLFSDGPDRRIAEDMRATVECVTCGASGFNMPLAILDAFIKEEGIVNLAQWASIMGLFQ